MAETKELTKEIASIDRDTTQLTFGGVLDNLDDTLKSRGQGKGLKIYDDIERDCHAYAVLEKRKNAVIAREWDVLAASEDAADVAAADFVREVFKGFPFDRLCKDMLDATLKGFSVGEIMWARDGARLVPGEIVARDQRRFKFAHDRSLRLITQARLMDGEIVPERKFIVHRFGSKNGGPYGLGLGHKLFWPVLFKRKDITFWLTFADKFGSPTSLGKYPIGTTEADQKKLLAALQAIAQDAGVIVPEGMAVELLEAARAGSIDTYEKLARYMDEQISECVLGETMTTTAQASGLGSNQASVHNEVRAEVAKADADLLSDTLNDTLVRWLVEFNTPGARLPKVWRSFEEAEDLKARAERDQIIYNLGFQPTEDYIRETYGEGWEKREVPAWPAAVAPSFTEAARKPDYAETQAGRLDREAQAALDAMIDQVRALVEQANSLDDLREKLIEIYPALDAGAFANVMQRALAASALAGRTDILEQARGG